MVTSSFVLPSSFPHRNGSNENNGTDDQTVSSRKGNNAKKKVRPRIPILRYEDEWVCVNKPVSMSVYRNKNTSPRQLVVSTSLKRQLSRKVYPVHRLDHRTSGALLFAFNSEMAASLHSALKKSSAKEYIALLRGKWPVGKDEVITVDEPLNVDGVMKDAKTMFECIATINGSEENDVDFYRKYDPSSDNDNQISIEALPIPPCTLVRVRPVTGRQHQIRRHAFKMSMPIIGDSEHGDSRANRWWRVNLGLNRLALHCFSIGLELYANSSHCDGKKIGNYTSILAPIPDDFKKTLARKELKELWMEACEKDIRLETDMLDTRGGSFGRRSSRVSTDC